MESGSEPFSLFVIYWIQWIDLKPVPSPRDLLLSRLLTEALHKPFSPGSYRKALLQHPSLLNCPMSYGSSWRVFREGNLENLVHPWPLQCAGRCWWHSGTKEVSAFIAEGRWAHGFSSSFCFFDSFPSASTPFLPFLPPAGHHQDVRALIWPALLHQERRTNPLNQMCHLL